MFNSKKSFVGNVNDSGDDSPVYHLRHPRKPTKFYQFNDGLNFVFYELSLRDEGTEGYCNF